MFKILIPFILIYQISLSQNVEVNKLLMDGDKAFLTNDYQSSKEKYRNATVLDSLNKKAWYNLAASELNLGENEIACEHLYKSYELENQDASALIKQYCGEIKYCPKMFLNDVDEQASFITDNQKLPLMINNNLNPVYLQLLKKELRKSKILLRNAKGRTFLILNINKSGLFEGDVKRVETVDESEKEKVKAEVLNILKTLVVYNPAKYKGKAVETWPKFGFTINFEY